MIVIGILAILDVGSYQLSRRLCVDPQSERKGNIGDWSLNTSFRAVVDEIDGGGTQYLVMEYSIRSHRSAVCVFTSVPLGLIAYSH